MGSSLFAPVAHSSFLDFTSYGLTSSENFDDLAAISGTSLTDQQLTEVGAIIGSSFFATEPSMSVRAEAASDSDAITIALVLGRANDPTALLAGTWAERQAGLVDQTEIAERYGADDATWQGVLNAVNGATALSGLTGTIVAKGSSYVSSAESRTIWLTLNASEFAALFDTELLKITATSGEDESKFLAWAGDLSLPESIAASIAGLWIDQGTAPSYPEVANTAAVDPQDLPSGPQSPGNSLAGDPQQFTPDIIAGLYNFPLSAAYAAAAGSGATTSDLAIAGLTSPTVALVEGGTQTTLEDYLNLYRATLNLPDYNSAGTTPFAPVRFVNLTGSGTTSGETTLDISIIAAAAPNSSQVLHGLSGPTTYTAYQSAIFDLSNDPAILTTSYSDHVRPSPDSPFAWAYRELFVDAQLRNISVFMSSGDGGSQAEYGTGSPLVHTSHAVPTAIIVGGTSISTYGAAMADTMLHDIVKDAGANDVFTLLHLVEGGLKTAPDNLQPSELQIFVETVWNEYDLGDRKMSPSYLENDAGAGGIDTGQAMPSYQADFGLSLEGRGVPDVSALAGGNTAYTVLNADFDGSADFPLTTYDGGTSASAPLWAALTAQIDVVFEDQGLANLGYFNDLLYIAAAVAPGSFNDVQVGNNIATYFYYADTADSDYVIIAHVSHTVTEEIVATGEGYEAKAGYDLTTGLGTPNGLLLARALTAIAHIQTGTSAQPEVVSTASATVAESGAEQSLLVQVTGGLGDYEVNAGGATVSGSTSAGDTAWTRQVAQQVLQADFDPALVRLLDGISLNTPSTVAVDAGDDITAQVGSTALGLYQAGLTAAYGFASFGGLEDGVTVARPVAIAETPGDSDGQDVILRLRQNGGADSTLMVYRVDDLLGTVDGIRPGEAGYEDAALDTAYVVAGGDIIISGPGFGNYAEVVIQGVDDGDILAMRLTAAFEDGIHTYWAFAEGNESVGDDGPVTHLWSYGLNTWGWEDQSGGGDQDFNDLIVQFDFTSLTGHELLA